MKKLILSTALVAGLALGAFAQGTILFDASRNASMDPAATSDGLFWINTGSGPVLLNQDVNAVLLGGSSAASLVPIATLLLSDGTAELDITFLGNGVFLDFSGTEYNVPGTVGGGVGVFEVQAWTGLFNTYATALEGGAFVAQTAAFSDSLGGLVSGNNVPAGTLGHMPAIVLSAVPEPSTFALMGLGAAALLIFRRRK